MTLGSALAIYFIMWWLSLLVVLPFGARTQEEAGEVVPGTEGSAPARPMIVKRLVAASILAGIAFLIFYVIWVNDLVSLDDFTIFDPPSVAEGA